MTHPAFFYQTPLGGSNGGHRQALAQASGGAAYASNLAQQGALAQAYANALNASAFANFPNPKPEPIEDAGIRAGEIIGHRTWVLRPDGLMQSMAVDYIWQPGHIAPATDLASAGFHAFKTKDDALRTYYPYHLSQALIFGTVALWGEVIEHERGYRAEYAAVHSLDSLYENPPSGPDKLDAARKRYGVAANE